VAATRKVADGDLHYTIALPKRDEIGMLAQSFNAMTQKLSEAQRQVYQAEKLAAVGQLAAGVAHEINNPLTGVLSYSSFLLKGRKTNRIQEDLEVIVRETQRCRGIVKVCWIRSAVRAGEARGRHQRIVERASASCNCSPPSSSCAGICGPARLRRHESNSAGVVNLLNANDAIGDGGAIAVRTDFKADGGATGAHPTEVEIRVTTAAAAFRRAIFKKSSTVFFPPRGRRAPASGLRLCGALSKNTTDASRSTAR
jgi:two-component system NtrC family sensor kinase